MNWSCYKFSKECEPELLEFLKVAHKQNNQSNLSPELKELWNRYLPLDEDILQKIATIKSSEIECIDLSSSDEEIDQTRNKPKAECDVSATARKSDLSLNKTRLNVNTTDTEDLIDGVKELLETESTLAEDIIRQFGRECSAKQLEEMFELFSEELNFDCILKLWESISNCNGNERDLVATYFSRHILSAKVLYKDIFVEELLSKMFSVVPDVVASDLSRVLKLTADTRQLITLRKHLDVLTDGQKNILLQKLLDDCSSLEEKQIANMLSLVTKDIDLTTVNSIIEVMYNNAKEFAPEKMFGKLILTVLETLGGDAVKYQSQMRYIISNHKSLYESQINKMFYGILQENRHNMSTNISRI